MFTMSEIFKPSVYGLTHLMEIYEYSSSFRLPHTLILTFPVYFPVFGILGLLDLRST